VLVPKSNPDEATIETMSDILGGSFISRLNMNLREDKHWSYGAGAFVADTKGQRPMIFYAPVQTDKTKEALAEIAKEVAGIRGTRPVTAEELQASQDIRIRTLAGRWETNGAVEGGITEIVSFGLPDDYFEKLPDRIRGVRASDVDAIAKKTIDKDRLVWVVVGDRAKIEPKIRELGWGEIRVIDADGNPVN
jgi:zinc protease